uniref:Spliceosome-associated protein CWC27 homolog n=1 Tax=Parastrongyloides trichosuri TaxID=131310 RepID=A0A0N4ZQR5_PARTI
MAHVGPNEPRTTGKVTIVTTAGDINIELWCNECPLACKNFIQHCLDGYYNDTIFHRIIPKFIIQGGDPTGTGDGGEAAYEVPFKTEVNPRLRFNRRGLLGMANSSKDDNKSQFFFTLDATPDLQGKHTLFGTIVGDTLYNMLKIADVEIGENDRPERFYSILSTKVTENPYQDIIRQRVKKKHIDEDNIEKKDSGKIKEIKLLSFGDEMLEAEEIAATFKGKSKSAHDVLEDEKLSREFVVDPSNFKNEPSSLSNSTGFRKRKDKKKVEKIDNVDMNIDKIISESKQQQNEEKLKSLKNEIKAMQKEYKKSLKQQRIEEEEEKNKSENVKEYYKTKLKFKDKSKNILKLKDPKREEQTMEMLDKFRSQLHDLASKKVLTEKKCPVVVHVEEKKEEDNVERIQMPNLDWEAEDLPNQEWMVHEFVAPVPDPNVTRAKDANLKDESEDWYDITDPRNKINIRKRMKIDNDPI